jgi:L-idonate 5-dehydrogenase
MDAVVIRGRQDVTVEEVRVPPCAPGQVRLRVGYVGICGSDLHYYFDGANGAFVVTEPLVPGHELAGWVEHDPSGTWPPGTPVTVHPARFGTSLPGIAQAPHLWPGGSYLGSASTTPHTQGAMVDDLVVDAAMVRVLPDTLPVRRATLAEPLAVALHGVGRAGDLQGARVLVCGAGPIGLLAVVAARARRGRRRRQRPAARSARSRRRTGGRSHLACRQRRCSRGGLRCGARVLGRGGRGQHCRLRCASARRRRADRDAAERAPSDQPCPVVAKEVTLTGAFRFLDEMEEAIALLDAQPGVESVITHEFAPSNAEAAFETARDSASSAKVIVAMASAREAGQ